MRGAIYGKLPSHGDFVARNLSGSLRAEFDIWLTQLVDAALPEDGLRALVFRSDQWWLIVARRSHDRSGRVFPIAAITPFDGQDFEVTEDWATQAATILQRAVEATLDVDTLCRSLPEPLNGKGTIRPETDLVWTTQTLPTPAEEAFLDLSSD